MLHILWGILKIILILAGILVGLAAILIFLVLFCPIRYQLSAICKGKEAFAKADTQKVTNVFQGAGSFGYGVSLKASMVNVYAKSDAAKQSGLYGNNAQFDATMLAGNTFTDLF